MNESSENTEKKTNGDEPENRDVFTPHNPLFNRILGKKMQTYCCKSKKDTGFLGSNNMVGVDCAPSTTTMCNFLDKKFRCANDDPKHTLRKNENGMGFITTDDEENFGSNCNFVPGLGTRALKGALEVAAPFIFSPGEYRYKKGKSDTNDTLDLERIMKKSKSGGKKNTRKIKKNTRKIKNKKTHKKK